MHPWYRPRATDRVDASILRRLKPPGYSHTLLCVTELCSTHAERCLPGRQGVRDRTHKQAPWHSVLARALSWFHIKAFIEGVAAMLSDSL